MKRKAIDFFKSSNLLLVEPIGTVEALFSPWNILDGVIFWLGSFAPGEAPKEKLKVFGGILGFTKNPLYGGGQKLDLLSLTSILLVDVAAAADTFDGAVSFRAPNSNLAAKYDKRLSETLERI